MSLGMCMDTATSLVEAALGLQLCTEERDLLRFNKSNRKLQDVATKEVPY